MNDYCCVKFKAEYDKGTIDISRRPNKHPDAWHHFEFFWIMGTVVIRTNEEKDVIAITHCPLCGEQLSNLNTEIRRRKK